MPVKIGSLAENFGILVSKSVLEPKISGLIQPSSEAISGFKIKVNRYESAERQRFTIAHEIAHFLLHRDMIGDGIVDNILYRSSMSSRIETEANQLAAELIMPRAHLKERLTAMSKPVNSETALDLADEFRVSVPAMRVRLGLGLET